MSLEEADKRYTKKGAAPFFPKIGHNEDNAETSKEHNA
jgi:hypothetical protein